MGYFTGNCILSLGKCFCGCVPSYRLHVATALINPSTVFMGAVDYCPSLSLLFTCGAVPSYRLHVATTLINPWTVFMGAVDYCPSLSLLFTCGAVPASFTCALRTLLYIF